MGFLHPSLKALVTEEWDKCFMCISSEKGGRRPSYSVLQIINETSISLMDGFVGDVHVLYSIRKRLRDTLHYFTS